MTEKTMDTIYVYCDGACSGNPGPGGWAAVLILPEGHVKEIGGGDRSTTNNRMEMTAAITALHAVVDRPEKVKVYTDSGLLINGMKGWLYGWKRKGWLTSAGEPVANRDLWERLDALAQAMKGRLSWGHVKGHAGHEINERCDEIAVAYSKHSKIALYDGPAVGCGYSLLEPGEEHLHKPKPKGTASKPRPKGPAVYLSYVGGRLERHPTWDLCKARVHGVAGAKFKKVTSREEESEVLKSWGAA